MIEAGLESPYAERLATWESEPEDEARLTTRVECSEYFAVRDQALLAHATQIDPEGPGSRCRWRSTNGPGRPRTTSSSAARGQSSLPEDDLFAGIAVPAGADRASTVQV